MSGRLHQLHALHARVGAACKDAPAREGDGPWMQRLLGFGSAAHLESSHLASSHLASSHLASSHLDVAEWSATVAGIAVDSLRALLMEVKGQVPCLPACLAPPLPLMTS